MRTNRMANRRTLLAATAMASLALASTVRAQDARPAEDIAAEEGVHGWNTGPQVRWRGTCISCPELVPGK